MSRLSFEDTVRAIPEYQAISEVDSQQRTKARMDLDLKYAVQGTLNECFLDGWFIIDSWLSKREDAWRKVLGC